MKSTFTLLFSLIISTISFGQCQLFPASLPQGNCADYDPLTSNIEIQTGETFGVCPISTSTQSFSNVNLIGGTLRICGNASITGMFVNGNIVVECGATAYFPAGLIMANDFRLVNYGTVIVTGNLVFEGSNNAVFNETANSRIFVNGSVNFAQTQAQTGYLRNRGYIWVDNTLDALDGGHLCLASGSKIAARNMRYLLNCGGPNFRFSYESNTGNAQVYIENTIVLRGVLTVSPAIQFLRGVGSSTNSGGCGSFGFGTVINNASAPSDPGPNNAGCVNCFTFLPVELIQFSGQAEDAHASLSWATASELNNDFFSIYHSTDGQDWVLIGTVDGEGNAQTENYYSLVHRDARPGTNYYRLDQTDHNGTTTSRGIVSVDIAHHGVIAYPNPSNTGNFHLLFESDATEGIEIFDLSGRAHPFELTTAENGANLKIEGAGSYIMRCTVDNETTTLRLLVTP